MNYRSLLRKCFAAAIMPLLGACQTEPLAPIATVPKVDLPRFMGDWYVIANIPTFLERNAHDPVESYRLGEDGTIETTFTFHDGGFDGPQKVYHPRGFVADPASNAVWGMQFIWPVQAEYRIIYLADDYSQTVIGRSKRDYVWIMARTPRIPDSDYQRLLQFIAAQGYDTARVVKAPQRPR
ncbi:lipocalin family protein [Noviherbaspirillum galbum]|uniref:Outer membrane lipoprotein Blc n=1 Tax=Noviherbaspirillum galbum TaxID=2709383 RepID=A0A6B3SLP7_9BURK|nr:lipocalin family protein [Noviherbaspirillum galbum]NEX59566.1 lipocalin family protein [Noviherbaspirillum galbum]